MRIDEGASKWLTFGYMKTRSSPLTFVTKRGVTVFRGDNGKAPTSNYYVRYARNGRREYFSLPSTKADAAKIADEIDRFLDVRSNTLDMAIQKFDPAKWEKLHPAARSATVGDVIKAHETAEKAIGVENKTGKNYRSSLVILFRQALRHRRGKVLPDEVIAGYSMDEFTMRLISDFKQCRVETAGENKEEQERKKRSSNGLLRSVRALFSTEARQHYGHLHLPAHLDAMLANMAYRKVEKLKFRLPANEVIARVYSSAWQLRDGYTENGVTHEPDRNAYLAFLLAGHAGLRKEEAAFSVRAWIEDTTPPRVWVKSTPEFKPKDKDARYAEVEQWVIDEILSVCNSPSYILGGNLSERTSFTFKRLLLWLKAKGLCAGNRERSVHELRKLYGSYIANTKGLYAAQKFLGHESADTTDRTYADIMIAEDVKDLWRKRPAWVPVPDKKPAVTAAS